MRDGRRVIWDLFSGFGGASQAFADDPMWKVFRFENNSDLASVPHTHILDVLAWREWIKVYPKPDFIWASPPCLEFSQAYNAPAPRAQRAGVSFEPNMEFVLAALDIIGEVEPTNWCIENVKGAIKPFSKTYMLGEPQHYSPFFLWGNLPPLILPRDFKHFKHKQDKRWSPLRSNHKAKIPIEISLAVKDAIENQKTLEDFI